ncbi:MAG: pyruvate ferredoxin oxidoreductase, partial [Methanomicrobiaceae archaeon]|nr:pyruvate ferredoxin oxidoreductase [Methanomicrobiaceae archaeon]
GATPLDASTTTSPAGKCSLGNKRPKKDLPRILAAHGAPYVATASISYPADFVKKVERAINTPGACYIQVHAPCCTGWGFDPGQTIAIGKLAIETGLWVNYEMVDGVVAKAKKVRRKPVEEYLKAQKRFQHLFKPTPKTEEIAKIQAMADANATAYNIDIKLKQERQ